MSGLCRLALFLALAAAAIAIPTLNLPTEEPPHVAAALEDTLHAEFVAWKSKVRACQRGTNLPELMGRRPRAGSGATAAVHHGHECVRKFPCTACAPLGSVRVSRASGQIFPCVRKACNKTSVSGRGPRRRGALRCLVLELFGGFHR